MLHWFLWLFLHSPLTLFHFLLSHLFDHFATEEVDQKALAAAVLVVLVPQIAGEDQQRFDAQRHFAALELGQRLELLQAELDHVQHVVVVQTS